VGLLPWGDALQGIARGTDVYLFLTGMMLLAELGRREGLFDWLSAWAVHAARGSAQRLFTLVFGVGLVVTVFLSNDWWRVSSSWSSRWSGPEPWPS
jgi:arsenical pump membrane protein